MNLSNLRPAEGSTKSRKRIGRGPGSGKGGTSTRGHKGAKSRSGYSRKRGFEGGQMPLQRRLPKYGFNNMNRVEYAPINIDALCELAKNQNITEFNIETFVANGLCRKNARVKVLGNGSLDLAVKVEAHAFSKSAKEAIENQGGTATLIK